MIKLSKTIAIYIFLLCSFYEFSAQEIVGGNPSFPPDDYSAAHIDQSKQNIYYEYTYVRNPENKSKTRSALTVLQIGTNFSKFVDFYTLKLDSLREKHSKLNRVEKNEMNEQMTYRKGIGFKMIIIKDFQNATFVIQSRIPHNTYEYEFEEPKMNWELKTDHKLILGYKVQKATITYAGRDWIAWFAEDIPIHLGPYTFGNLPGLILELYDDKENFHFIATGIDKRHGEIYKRNEKNIIKITKKDFLKTEKKFHDRPELFLNMESVRGIDKAEKIPYNPIEFTHE